MIQIPGAMTHSALHKQTLPKCHWARQLSESVNQRVVAVRVLSHFLKCIASYCQEGCNQGLFSFPSNLTVIFSITWSIVGCKMSKNTEKCQCFPRLNMTSPSVLFHPQCTDVHFAGRFTTHKGGISDLNWLSEQLTTVDNNWSIKHLQLH